MDLHIRSFRLQKAGNTFEECEDKAYPDFLNKMQAGYKYAKQSKFAFGLADGATEGIFSGEWAEILVKAFCRSRDNYSLNSIVEKATKDWGYWLKNYLDKREMRKKPVQWYEEPGLKTGSFSTLLGLRISDKRESEVGVWQALAVGDTCLFQIRGENLIQSFPIKISSAFDNHPSLICSNPVRNKELVGKSSEGEWRNNDIFCLATDALACWFLQRVETGNAPWLLFPFNNGNGNDLSFESWINGLRNEKKIKNDDAILIQIRVLDS